MRLRGWLSWQLWVFSTLVLFAGVATGVVIAGWVYLENIGTLAADINRKTSRIQLLEILAQQQLPITGVLALDAPAIAFPPVPATGAEARTTVTKAGQPRGAGEAALSRQAPVSPAVTGAQSHGSARSSVSESPVANSFSAAVTPAPIATAITETGSSVAEPGARPVTGEELVQALKFKIEGVNATKAGVAKLDRTGVHLKNGLVIRPGELFPSGERLLSVDHENERVVTSKRQILLFFGQN